MPPSQNWGSACSRRSRPVPSGPPPRPSPSHWRRPHRGPGPITAPWPQPGRARAPHSSAPLFAHGLVAPFASVSQLGRGFPGHTSQWSLSCCLPCTCDVPTGQASCRLAAGPPGPAMPATPLAAPWRTTGRRASGRPALGLCSRPPPAHCCGRVWRPWPCHRPPCCHGVAVHAPNTHPLLRPLPHLLHPVGRYGPDRKDRKSGGRRRRM